MIKIGVTEETPTTHNNIYHQNKRTKKPPSIITEVHKQLENKQRNGYHFHSRKKLLREEKAVSGLASKK